ncbi:membrane protein [Escherichia coli]|uniref:Membrane protein n=1 Tax=Escherichia coli TaxID=562 RepID=A0A8S0FFG5_ECOLX|nr:membrane protein [Escherichia coli]
MLINIGRLLMLCVWGFLILNLVHPFPRPLNIWGFLILNLVHPFPRPLNIFVNVALIFTVLMHGMQLALLKSTLPKDGPQMTTAEKVRIFLFGVFELLVWTEEI